MVNKKTIEIGDGDTPSIPQGTMQGGLGRFRQRQRRDQGICLYWGPGMECFVVSGLRPMGQFKPKISGVLVSSAGVLSKGLRRGGRCDQGGDRSTKGGGESCQERAPARDPVGCHLGHVLAPEAGVRLRPPRATWLHRTAAEVAAPRSS